jgi:hypothetical protein
MKLGSLPAAADPDRPTAADIGAAEAKRTQYQAIFDSH